MGRSATSCFKIIACGSDSVDKNDIDASESKGSSDKRGWSFRKRSARHRVLNNTVISETLPSGSKESPESATVNFQTQANLAVQEKTTTVQWTDEKPQLLASVDSKVSETLISSENDTKADVNLDESVIVVIQASIRGFLAQRALLKLKNILKLQAAVRGHLVRRHAVGTLRCIQAIIKMQALVRIRRARLSGRVSCTEQNLDVKHGKDTCSSMRLEKEKPDLIYTSSIEKLLRNGFARQLLESTPNTKAIHIKCDPSRSDSAWKWLERWMSVSSTGVEQSEKQESCIEQQGQEQVEHSACEMETTIPSESYCKSTDLKTSIGETALPSEDENLITQDTDNFDTQACQPISPSRIDKLDSSRPEIKYTTNLKENSLHLLPDQTAQQDTVSQMEINFPSSNHRTEREQPKHSIKRSAPAQENEGKKFMFGSRKGSNPAFVAAQSKFGELSLAENSARSISSSNQDVGVESNTDAVSAPMDNAIKTREIGLAENSVSHISRIQAGGSECGTELSITSTLDSPDGSEVRPLEFEKEATIEAKNLDVLSPKNLDIEANGQSITPESEASYSITLQPEKLDGVNGAEGDATTSVTVVDPSQSQVLQKSEKNASDVQIELDPEVSHQEYKSSPEVSPRSHMTIPESQGTPMTIPESQGTPSSQVSENVKMTKSGKSRSNPKHQSSADSKRSPLNSDHDSGARNSLEQLPKDHKTGKQRNSFSSARSNHVDQEPRDSSSSNSLPSYMQATESARAKAHANSSPKSSPDVQENDIYIKKRHSLPVAIGRQRSPRVQRSLSQTQQVSKGSGAYPHERKWQR